MKLPVFVQDLLERAAKSAAQAVVLTLGGDAINVWTVDWETVTGVGLGAAVLSAATSLASLKVGNSGTASLTEAVEPAGKHAAPDAT